MLIKRVFKDTVLFYNGVIYMLISNIDTFVQLKFFFMDENPTKSSVLPVL